MPNIPIFLSYYLLSMSHCSVWLQLAPPLACKTISLIGSRLYPDMIGGIFFDEGFVKYLFLKDGYSKIRTDYRHRWNECGPNNLYADVYRLISDNTKRKHPGAFTVLNPGDHMPRCFEER